MFKKHIKLLKAVLWFFWEFLGLHYICRKIVPYKDKITGIRPPTSFTIWVIGIYFALYGYASQKYQNRLDTIENRVSLIISQLNTEDYENCKIALERIPVTQKLVCSLLPSIKNPVSVIRSFISKPVPHADTVEYLKEIIVSRKSKLNKANLSQINLKGANLIGANLEEVNLERADFEGAILERAFFAGAKLKGANLEGANLIGTLFLTIEQLSNVKTLYNASLDPQLMKQIKDNYPHLLEKPKLDK